MAMANCSLAASKSPFARQLLSTASVGDAFSQAALKVTDAELLDPDDVTAVTSNTLLKRFTGAAEGCMLHVGYKVGRGEGSAIVGLNDGNAVGVVVGLADGRYEGGKDGVLEGFGEGDRLGLRVGLVDGAPVKINVSS